MSINSEGAPDNQLSPEEADVMRRAFDEAFSSENIAALVAITSSQEAVSTWPELVVAERMRRGLGSLSFRQLSTELADRAVRSGTGITIDQAALNLEAAERIAQLDRLTRLLGLLAPGGTAPRTALEQIYKQSLDNSEESQIVLDLRAMLEQHWAEWTPALREAEGLPPAETL